MTLTRLIARPMLASMFVVGGVNALRNTDAIATRAKPVVDKVVPKVREMLPDVPVPEDARTLVRLNAGVHIAAGLGLATGRAPRLSALALAATLVPTTAVGHPFWEESDPASRAEEKTQFLKNLSMLGGLLIAAADTGGRPGVVWRTKHAATDARREARHIGKAARREAKLAARSVAR